MGADEEAIRTLVTTWMAATKARDTETVLGLMTDDVVFLVPGREPFGKAAFAEASRAQAGASMEFDGESEIQEIRIAGDWAYVRSRLKVTARQPGAPAVVRTGHTLSIMRKEGDRWRLARDANLLSAPAEGAAR